MPLQKNLNVSPYYADYDPLSDYYKVLFKAGYPIQARELTNSQLMMQNQMETFMSRFLKEGDTVVPGEFGYSNSAYVRLASITQGATAEEFVGYTITGVSSGVKAFVNLATAETSTDDITFYVTYESSGTSAEQPTFSEGETIESDTPNRYTGVVGVNGVSKPITTTPLGQGSVFTVKEGYYFVNGTAVRCAEQRITLDKYGTTPTYSVGFVVTEEFITSAENPALLDNSQGSSNFAAPGADRLKIVLTLSKRPIDDDFANPNFIGLGKIEQGIFLGDPTQRTKWAWLYDILAKRTYEQAGDYILTEFPVEILEYINADLQNGLFNSNEFGTYPPVPGSGQVERLTPAEADGKFAIKLSPGMAYVQGYRVGSTKPAYLFGNKPRTQNFRNDSNTQITSGPHVSITNLNGIPDLANIDGAVDTLGSETIVLYRNFNDGYVGQNFNTDSPATVNIGNKPVVTYHCICSQQIGPVDNYNTIYRAGHSAVLSGSTPLHRGDSIGGAVIAAVTVMEPTPTGILTPRYLMPQAVVENQTNSELLGYNSTYDMGIVAAEYFTDFFLVDDNSVNFTDSWSQGNLVTGVKTGSTGVVEEGTTFNRLILSNITGEFEPGENVEQGNKKSRIAREGEVYNFVFTDFGTGDSTVSLVNVTNIKVTAIGAELNLTNSGNDPDFVFSAQTKSLIPTATGRNKLQNFPYPVGSSLAQRINYKLLATPGNVNGYANQVQGKIENTASSAKSFYAPQDTQNSNFTADISIQNNKDAEIVPVASGSLFSGKANENFLVCDDFNGDPSEQLQIGDVITFVDDEGLQESKIVTFATKPVGYGEAERRDSAHIYFTTTLLTTVTGKSVQRARIKKKGEAIDTLLFQLPQGTVASLQSDPLATGINYTVMQEFVVETQSGATSITISTSKQNETFINNLSQTTITVASGSSTLIGRQLRIESATTAASGREIILNLGAQLSATTVSKILIPVYITNGSAKIKTLTNDFEVSIGRTTATTQRILPLGVTDVVGIQSIMAGSNDITDNYLLDNGQRDNVYTMARLILKPGVPFAKQSLKITLSYFEHSGDGDFFSVDSYIADGGVNYEAIPFYLPDKLIPINSQGTGNIAISLRDCIDFRPVVNVTGSDPSVLPVPTANRSAIYSTNFRDAGSYDGNGSVPRFPLIGSLFISDIAYYMPRIDSLFIEYDGAFKLVEGTPSNNPVRPPDLATGMRLYDFVLPPYTFTVKSIDTVKYNYTRYTMADISSIDSKVQRLEQLVTLSLLEQGALNMQVRDAVTGLSRFKNGIVVDSFSNHALGAVGLEQYRNSIDPKLSQLRAAHYTDQVQLIETAQTPLARKGDGYRKTGPFLTVDYESQRFMQNPFATRFINLQPYSVFTFDGRMVLTPSVDTFQDITQLPDLVIEDNNIYDAMVNLTGSLNDSGIGTVWSDWETTGKAKLEQENTYYQYMDGMTRSEMDSVMRALLVSGAEVHMTGAAQNIFGLGGVPPIKTYDEIRLNEFSRDQTTTTFNVNTGTTVETSYGDRVVDVQLAKTMRTIPVGVQIGRMKPNSRYYLFFDDIDCSAWFSCDTIQTDFPDGISRYQGTPGTSQKGFGTSILSDGIGNISGIFLIPNGRAPVGGSVFTTLEDVDYQTDGETRSFNTGERKVRVTTSKENAQDLEVVEAFAEGAFISSGVLLDKQETIVSTRMPDVGFTTEVTAIEDEWRETSRQRKAVYFDPVAQTFLIDDLNPEGLFVTELDVFFKTKDPIEGVEAYLTSTDGQVPTETVLPFSRIVKNTDTTLRVVCEMTGSAANKDSVSLTAGEQIVGKTSGATGVIKSTVEFKAARVDGTRNVTNTVYNVILNNYDGEFLPGEQITYAGTQTQEVKETYTIVTDEYNIDDVRLTALGSGYVNPSIVFSAPQLPGGEVATGTVRAGTADEGRVIFEVTITNRGSGYTQVPTVSFEDTSVGTGAAAQVLVTDGVRGVDMGVSTSEDATAATKFKFETPIYLLGDTNYAFVLKAPTSLNYTCWTSKLGENMVGTETRVSQQPNLGSLFKSQNGGLWTEDQTQDIKFVLYRAEFETAARGEIHLNNAPLRMMKLKNNPIETNDSATTGDDDKIFGNNPKIARVYAQYHGLRPGDLVFITGVIGNPGTIPSNDFNTVHTVLAASLEYFTIEMGQAATNSERGGGASVKITPNKPYEVLNVSTGAMVFASSSIIATNKATQAAGVTGYNVLNQYKPAIPNEISLADSYYYNGAYQVANQLNESKYNGSNGLRGGKSMEMTVSLSTVNSKVSPVLDLDRTNANVITNLIDNPKGDDDIQGSIEAVIELKARTMDLNYASGYPLKFTKGGVNYSVIVNSYNAITGMIRVKGRHIDKLVGATYDDTVLQSIGANITLTSGTKFIPETSPDGSVYAKWISRQFIFENACDGMEMKLGVVQYDKTSIRAYYRPRPVGSETDITQDNWTPFNNEQELTVTNTSGQTTSVIYPGLPDNVNKIKVRDSINVDPRVVGPSGYTSLTFSVQDIAAFDSVQIKIVMTAENPAQAPLIDDMQLICSE